MKRILFITVMMTITLGFSMHAQAALQNLGEDSLGNRLIYDTDLDITWYDFKFETNTSNNWEAHKNWAANLVVDINGTSFDDWRLPITIDGPYVSGYDGTTTAGWSITSSEMGHLYYSELGNPGSFGVDGHLNADCFPLNTCLLNTGPFLTLAGVAYNSGTAYANSSNEHWYFVMKTGSQFIESMNTTRYAMAVRDGLTVAPEPISSILFIAGGVTLGFKEYRRKFMK